MNFLVVRLRICLCWDLWLGVWVWVMVEGGLVVCGGWGCVYLCGREGCGCVVL